jgi:hypothetical protein
MVLNKTVRRIAVVGTGVIGSVQEPADSENEVLVGLLRLRAQHA